MSAARRITLIALCLFAAGVPSVHQKPVAPVYGAETPQAVMTAMEAAIAADDFNAMLPLISPQGREDLANDAITALVLALNFLNPDDPMPRTTPVPPGELESKRKNYQAALGIARDALRPYALDTLIGQPPLAPRTKDALDAALAKADTVVLMRSLYTALQQIGTTLGMEKTDEKKVPWRFGKVTDYQISGDTATARTGTDTIEFERIQGRWYLKPPLK